MPTVRKSVIVARPAEALFALVDDVEQYPSFLPWCSGATLIERTPTITQGRIEIDYHGLKSHVATINRKEPPEWMHLDFTEGPFERFHGHWHFTPLGADGCRVEFALDYAFDSKAIELVLGPVFGHIAETLVDRFVARAEAQNP
ncbi:type II toxin-antitoxin system RatA family toxin [Usitatibacter palustris]|uniref:Persistence and stress-resistance toxin PasT n=1 Tax=Usitatibacter palustris TaxID=2732487 RepID=A0A6M4H4F0_9PROT|nr:type II toxin-antitoxin system RatA family toxin [Usitatibacter palustris]QJR14491.1 Persistence and stress-resistance toxin PasT [Usitatibacter palustris]